ncbi:MAG: pyridoxamine kinase [Lachnospiraceae bacterium]|nr:pyridoxamine kinase [Lachnospiraceae bacterium]
MKIAVINDMSGYGRCSLTVALPIISAMKVQACPVPTALFSNHTGFPTFRFFDFTKHMAEYLQGFADLGLDFDAIYCGFLGSMDQIQIVEHFVASQKNALFILDPVMGDHGKAYSTITPSHCEAMKKLAAKADIITPNLTEACLLTDTPFPASIDNVTDEFANSLSDKLHDLGAHKIVITGTLIQGLFHNYILEETDAKISHSVYRVPAAGQSRPGTGDVFASVIAADAVNGVAFTDSVRKAAAFVSTCTAASDQEQIPVENGVCFEYFLKSLTS